MRVRSGKSRLALRIAFLSLLILVTSTRARADVASVSPCGSSAWVVRAPVPYAARGIFAASDGTYVYAGGGYDGSTVHSDLKRYDPATDTWSSLASSPDAHFLSPAVYSPVTNKVYNFGGFNSASSPTNITRIYDIAGNSWTTGAPMPAALTDQSASYYNGIVYVAGGYNGTTQVSTLYAYDIAGNTWSTLAPMPQGVYLPGFGAINGKVYIAAGNNGAELNTLYIYDIASNSWSTGAPVPQAVTAPGSTVLNGLLFLYGGGFPTTKNITQIYDPVANSWTSGPNLNVNRLWFYGTAVGNSIVAPGGDQNPGIPVNSNEELTCGTSLTALSPAMVWVGLANSDDVGIKFDLQAIVSVNGTQVGSGHLDSVAGGSSGFNNAKLDAIPLSLPAPASVSTGDTLSIEVFARNACSGSGHNSGRARLWYNGQPIDTGAGRDAGTRFDATINGTNSDYFLRAGSALSTTAGPAKISIDVSAGPKCGPFVSFGTWTITLP